MARAWLFNVAFLLASVHLSSSTGHSLNSNPVRKVITMLLTMKTTVEEEAATQEKLYDQFMCECKKALATLQSSVDASSSRVPQLQSNIKEGKAEEDSLKGDLGSSAKDQKEAEDTLADAKALREKEALAFQKEKEETTANIATLGEGVTALGKGLAGAAFLQTSAAVSIRRLMASMDLSAPDRDVLSAFFQQDQSDSNSEELDSPPTMEIVGILKQMSDTMTKELAESEIKEEKAAKDYAEMKTAKESQIDALKGETKTKGARLTEVGMTNVQNEQDLEQTEKSLEEAQQSMANKKAACDARTASYAELRKTQGEEDLAISETVKILNSGAAEHLFKKTFPMPVFLQIEETGPEARQEALKALQGGRRGDPRIDFLALNIRSKKNSFDKVVDMIDKMRALLVKEQQDDVLKKDNCKAEIQKTTIELHDLNNAKDDIEKELQVDTEKAMETEKEIAELAKSIKELDKQVAEAAQARKEENQEYIVVLADKGAAKDILGVAKRRMEQFFGKFYQVGSRSLRHTQARPVVASLFDGPMSFTQVSKQRIRTVASQAQPEPPAGAAPKDPSSVLTMIDTLVADIEKDIQENTADEQSAQKEYTIFVEDSNKQRATDAQTLAEKEALKASLEAKLHKSSQLRKSKMKTAEAKLQYLQDKHTECDFLLENFEKRRDAREAESDALQRAKAVLTGADEGVSAFLQVSSRQKVRLHSRR